MPNIKLQFSIKKYKKNNKKKHFRVSDRSKNKKAKNEKSIVNLRVKTNYSMMGHLKHSGKT